MKDLKENLEPEDLEELGLKLGEKRRLKKFLNKLHTQDTQVESVTGQLFFIPIQQHSVI